MKLNNVAFLTTIYPMKEQFLLDFFGSLSKQTYKNFDVIVVNDNYQGFDKIKERFFELNFIELSCKKNPAKNREYGINFCKNEKYEVLIFGDSDDYFSNNRVELSLRELKNYDIVVNDVSLFDQNGIYETRYMSNRLKDNSRIDYEYIRNKNIFGLSNTAINLDILDDKVVFDENLVAVDWSFYKLLLKNKKSAIFINKSITFYRQHKDNTLGLRVVDDYYYLWWENEMDS